MISANEARERSLAARRIGKPWPAPMPPLRNPNELFGLYLDYIEMAIGVASANGDNRIEVNDGIFYAKAGSCGSTKGMPLPLYERIVLALRDAGYSVSGAPFSFIVNWLGDPQPEPARPDYTETEQLNRVLLAQLTSNMSHQEMVAGDAIRDYLETKLGENGLAELKGPWHDYFPEGHNPEDLVGSVWGVPLYRRDFERTVDCRETIYLRLLMAIVKHPRDKRKDQSKDQPARKCRLAFDPKTQNVEVVRLHDRRIFRVVGAEWHPNPVKDNPTHEDLYLQLHNPTGTIEAYPPFWIRSEECWRTLPMVVVD